MFFDVEPVTPAFSSEARYWLSFRRVIGATCDEVFEALTDTAGFPACFDGFRGSDWVTPPPHGRGSVREVRLTPLAVREHFVVWEPGRQLTFTVVGANVPLIDRMLEDYRLAPVADRRCELVWRVFYEPKRFLGPAHALVRPMFDKMFGSALETLVERLEAGTARAA